MDGVSDHLTNTGLVGQVSTMGLQPFCLVLGFAVVFNALSQLQCKRGAGLDA